MQNRKNRPIDKLTRLIKKFFLSAFVVVTFAAYALHKPFSSAAGNISLITQAPSALVLQTTPASGPLTSTGTTGGQSVLAPTATVAQAASPYKNGSFTGSQVDAFYGLVQVQVVIQNGKITDVQVPEYPSDRRTSVRINRFAVPQLQQEVIQAQQANVDIVSGATLTSQAFMMSLQSALDRAKS